MAQLVIPQGVLVRLIWTRGGSDYAVNVLGALNPGPVTVNQALANTVGTAIKARLTSTGHVGDLASTIALSKVTLRDVSIPNQGEFPDSGGPVVGTDATTGELPPQVALVITLRTALAGPRFRGRIYLPGFSEATSLAGACVSGNAENARLFVAGISTDLSTSGLTLAVFSRPVDADPTATPPIAGRAGLGTAVTSIVTRNLVWDTQRRRAIAGI